MQQYFNELADWLVTQLGAGEDFTAWLSAEATDFVRFNKSLIRQPGHVRQATLSFTLIHGKRHAGGAIDLTGERVADHSVLGPLVAHLRAQLADLPEDPYLLLPDSVQSSEHVQASRLPASKEIVDAVLSAAKGYDLVGILAAGPVYRGFANAAGQRNWQETSSFNLDWSLYQNKDKAVKTSYAGFDWDAATFATKFASATAALEVLKREPVTVKPGAYRAYLTPTAVGELVGMFNWSGFSEKSLRTKQSSLRRMREEGLALNPMVHLRENTAEGLAPRFQPEGFTCPAEVALIDGGKLAGSMISPRTAKEYGIAANGAQAGEGASSLDLAGGSLSMADALKDLGTGIYVSNLWYLNFSDRANCRVTGMTRFATFWVEDGVVKAPLNVMRFDDSLFRVLGDKLLGLTKERELLIDGSTYSGRVTDSMRLPGALVKDFTFVL